MTTPLALTEHEVTDLVHYMRSAGNPEGRISLIEADGYIWITDGADVFIIDRQPNGRLMLDDPPGEVPAAVRRRADGVEL
jgi:hypothetical protein